MPMRTMAPMNTGTLAPRTLGTNVLPTGGLRRSLTSSPVVLP